VVAEFLAAEVAGAAHSGTAEDAGDSQGTIDGRDGDQPLAWDGDSAYGTGDLRAAVAAAEQNQSRTNTMPRRAS
jgi:hypothetical protein